MQNVCRCMQCLQHLNYYWTFLKLSVNLNLRTAKLPIPDVQASNIQSILRVATCWSLRKINLHNVTKVNILWIVTKGRLSTLIGNKKAAWLHVELSSVADPGFLIQELEPLGLRQTVARFSLLWIFHECYCIIQIKVSPTSTFFFL